MMNCAMCRSMMTAKLRSRAGELFCSPLCEDAYVERGRRAAGLAYVGDKGGLPIYERDQENADAWRAEVGRRRGGILYA